MLGRSMCFAGEHNNITRFFRSKSVWGWAMVLVQVNINACAGKHSPWVCLHDSDMQMGPMASVGVIYVSKDPVVESLTHFGRKKV
jgi:hypothetical protein